MIRVFAFTMEGSTETVQLASMSEGMAKKFTIETQEMLTANKPPQEWIDRRNRTILESMARAGANGTLPSLEALVDNYDSPTLTEMYLFIMEKSGLRLGEAKAASASAN
jgi:hypothetical protein